MARHDLHTLCREGNLWRVQEYAASLDMATLELKLVSRRYESNYTPLHEAASNGHSSVLAFLLDLGGSVNSRTKSGYTPLHLAASSGDVECVRVLLKHKADISAADELGKTAKQVAELSGKASVVRVLRSEGERAVHMAGAFGPNCIGVVHSGTTA